MCSINVCLKLHSLVICQYVCHVFFLLNMRLLQCFSTYLVNKFQRHIHRFRDWKYPKYKLFQFRWPHLLASRGIAPLRLYSEYYGVRTRCFTVTGSMWLLFDGHGSCCQTAAALELNMSLLSLFYGLKQRYMIDNIASVGLFRCLVGSCG